MNGIETQYLDLVKDILNTGVEKDTRNGKVLSVFGRQIRHNMVDGFPLLTTKKMAWDSIKTELQWFLNGSTDIRFLWKNKCFIWDGDWYSSYRKSCSTPYSLEEMKEFALNPTKHPVRSKFFSPDVWSLGNIYGHQWRNWNSKQIDQVADVIDKLTNSPDSRRILVSAWNPEQLNQMSLPPCHYSFQVYTRELSFEERNKIFKEKVGESVEDCDLRSEVNTTYDQDFDALQIPKRGLSLLWNQRSVDVGLGLPFNIASYALLLLMLADEANMVPEELIGSLGDAHIYKNQIRGLREQVGREPFSLPTVRVRDGIYSCLTNNSKDVELLKYQHHPAIKIPLST